MLKKVALICILITLIDGCKKYPEDDASHLFTAMRRLTNHDWYIKKYENMTTYTYGFGFIFTEIPFKFSKNGTCTGGGTVSVFDGNGNNSYINLYVFNFNGTWEFIENKNKIKVTHNPYHYTVWKIDQLDRTTMIIESDSIKYYLKK
ncbi:MAG: hypothetical protein V4511_15840 [Bacteroidota bacterium]